MEVNVLNNVFKNNRLRKAYDTIHTSFWFVPCVIILIILSLCAALVWLDSTTELEKVTWLDFLYHSDGAITRSLLTTIAGSLMTVVSITFSITMVALTNASSQFGHRLLRSFMNDQNTQIVLGTFTAIFLYCLVLVRVTYNFEQGNHLPGLAIGGAMLLTLLSIFLLIYFIHHVAINLQADTVIEKIYCQLQLNIEHIFSEQIDNESVKGCKELVLASLKSRFGLIKSRHSGYVQAINYSHLVELIATQNQCMELLIRPGDFVTRNMVVIKCSGDLSNESQQQLLSCIILGSKRTPIQDPEFAIMQLVEIALRALSPSINDSFSAIACVDKLSSTLSNLTRQTFPKGIACHTDREVRLVFKVASFQDLANTAYDQIRQNARCNLAVQLRLLEGLTRIAEQASTQEHWKLISNQKEMLENDLQKQELTGNDKAVTGQRLNDLNSLIFAAKVHD